MTRNRIDYKIKGNEEFETENAMAYIVNRLEGCSALSMLKKSASLTNSFRDIVKIRSVVFGFFFFFFGVEGDFDFKNLNIGLHLFGKLFRGYYRDFWGTLKFKFP